MADPRLESQIKRLKPVYDALDARNAKQNKNALKLVNAFLEKTPQSQLGRAVKALTLERLGRKEEALALCNEVQAEQPSDEAILATLLLVYKALRRVEESTKTYEAAAAKDPNNEALAVALFHAYVREGNFKKQQMCAMQIHKQFKKNDEPFYWMVTSILLQVPADAPRTHTLLTLAEKFLEAKIKPLIASPPPPSSLPPHPSQVMQLYLHVLHRERKYDTILSLLHDEASANVLTSLPHERQRLEAETLAKLGRYDRAAELYRALLSTHTADEWAYLRGLLDASFALEAAGAVGSVNTAREFIRGLPRTMRGPRLAEIEIEKRLLEIRSSQHTEGTTENGSGQDIYTPLLSLLVDYMAQFGNKQCCHRDVINYALLLPMSARQTLADRILATFPALPAVDETTPEGRAELQNAQADRLRRKATLYHLEHLCGLHGVFNSRDYVSLATRLFGWYRDYAIGGLTAPTEESEWGHGDELALLAARVFYEAYNRFADVHALLRAVNVLEFLLARSKYNFAARLALVRLYGRLGCWRPLFAPPAVDERGVSTQPHCHYRMLDLKHIQLVTLTHLFLSDLVVHGFVDDAQIIVDEILKFDADNRKDLPDQLIHPYKHGSYVKAFEFVEFKDRLERSAQLAVARIEGARMILARISTLQDAAQSLQDAANLVSEITDEVIARMVHNEDNEVLAPLWTDLAPQQHSADWFKAYVALCNLLKAAFGGKAEPDVASVSTARNAAVTSGTALAATLRDGSLTREFEAKKWEAIGLAVDGMLTVRETVQTDTAGTRAKELCSQWAAAVRWLADAVIGNFYEEVLLPSAPLLRHSHNDLAALAESVGVKPPRPKVSGIRPEVIPLIFALLSEVATTTLLALQYAVEKVPARSKNKDKKQLFLDLRTGLRSVHTELMSATEHIAKLCREELSKPCLSDHLKAVDCSESCRLFDDDTAISSHNKVFNEIHSSFAQSLQTAVTLGEEKLGALRGLKI